MRAELFEQHRPRLTGVAYGMLGSVMEAEDVVQDAWLRWADADVEGVDNPAGWLTTVVTRLAIDRLRSARARREAYVGPWLPEPVIDEGDPAERVAEAEALSMALLTALERLNPVERAVFLLREVFDLDYPEIADVVDRSPTNCRQIASRARDRVGDPGRHHRPPPAREREIVGAFETALRSGDLDGLQAVLAEDVVLWSDGGEAVRAARHPVVGRDRVARFLLGVARQAPPGIEAAQASVNGDPGFVVRVGGTPYVVMALEVTDGGIVGVRNLLNPEKLAGV